MLDPSLWKLENRPELHAVAETKFEPNDPYIFIMAEYT